LGAGTERFNVHLRNLSLVGNRDGDGSDRIYTSRMIRYTSASSGSIRLCSLTGFQFIQPTDQVVAASPDIADAVWGARTSSLKFSNGVLINCDDFVFDSNYVEPAALANWPVSSIAASDSDGGSLRFTTTAPHGRTSGTISVSGHSVTAYNATHTIASVTDTTITTLTSHAGNGTGGGITPGITNSGINSPAIDFDGVANPRFTRNTCRGTKANTMLRMLDVTGFIVADNDMQCADKVCIDVFNSTGGTIERNRLHDFGINGVAMEGGGAGIQISYRTRRTSPCNITSSSASSRWCAWQAEFKSAATQAVCASMASP
jgi:hypothetical protein